MAKMQATFALVDLTVPELFGVLRDMRKDIYLL